LKSFQHSHAGGGALVVPVLLVM